MRGMRRPLAPPPKQNQPEWGVLPKLRATAVGLSGAAWAQPGRSKAEAAAGGLRRRGKVNSQALEVKAGQQVQVEQATNQVSAQVSAIERENAVAIGSEKTGIPGELVRWDGKAVNGLRLVHVSRNIRRTELREATTGRPVRVAKIWAVAETSPAAPQPKQQAQPVKPGPSQPQQPKVELAFYRKY